MTRIAEVRLDRLSVHLTEPVRFGSRMATWREVGILHLVADDGIEGIGELGLDLVSDHETSPSSLDSLRRALVGLDVAERVSLEVRMIALPGERRTDRSVRSAVETAMLDLLGRASGRPVAAVLGATRTSVAVNAVLMASAGPARGLDDLCDSARSLAHGGFGTLKIKRDADALDPIAIMRAVREAVGPAVVLRLDLNGDLTEEKAIDLLPGLQELDLEYVEQPIDPALGPAALGRVRRAIGVPVAADEGVEDPAAAAALLAEGAVDVLVVKPARVGGPRQALAIARAAEAVGARTTISTFYETGIGLAAALHVAAAIPGEHAHGLATGALLEDDLIVDSLAVEGGRMTVPGGPGLGVELDLAAVDRLTAGSVPPTAS